MYIFFLTAIILAFPVILVFIAPLRLSFLLDTCKSLMRFDMLWLRGVVRLNAQMLGTRPVINVSIFGRHIFTKHINKKGAGTMMFLGAVKLKGTAIKAYYGLSDPFSTGILCAAAEFIKHMYDIRVLEHFPEFLPAEEYAIINASSRLNIGSTLINLFKAARKSKTAGRKKYGSVTAG